MATRNSCWTARVTSSYRKGEQRVLAPCEPERRCVQKKDIYGEFKRKHKGDRPDVAFKRSWEELVKKDWVTTIRDIQSRADMDMWVYLERE